MVVVDVIIISIDEFCGLRRSTGKRGCSFSTHT